MIEKACLITTGLRQQEILKILVILSKKGISKIRGVSYLVGLLPAAKSKSGGLGQAQSSHKKLKRHKRAGFLWFMCLLWPTIFACADPAHVHTLFFGASGFVGGNGMGLDVIGMG